jgi:hypothetical protein
MRISRTHVFANKRRRDFPKKGLLVHRSDKSHSARIFKQRPAPLQTAEKVAFRERLFSLWDLRPASDCEAAKADVYGNREREHSPIDHLFQWKPPLG